MEKNVLHYFVDTNSSRGFVSFWESNFGKLEKVVKLDGYPDLLVTQLVSQACAQALGCEQEVELVHNCLDNSLQGMKRQRLGNSKKSSKIKDLRCC